MKKVFAAIAGFTMFVATWIILGKALLGLLFPQIYAEHGSALSGIMALGAVVAMFSFLIQELVSSAINGGDE